MIAAALEHRDFANMARFQRMALHARALEHDLRHNHTMASFLVAGADAAGEVAQTHSEIAMWLCAIGEPLP